MGIEKNAQETHVVNIKQLMNTKRAPFIITTVHAPRDMHILTNAFSIELTLFVLQGQSCKNVF
jgi:hypothetical protein